MNIAEDVKDILKKYEKRLEGSVKMDEIPSDTKFSSEYKQFRKESLPSSLSWYEKLCNKAENIISVNAPAKDYDEINRSIETAHLQISPEGAVTFATLISGFLILFAIFLSAFVYLLFDNLMIFFPLIIILTAAIIFKPLSKLPVYIANSWRLKASNQMVLCMLYVVIYMRHTSNLEHAIKFASSHIGPPLSLDFRKVFWDVETGTFPTIRGSLDHYLETWREYNLEFINSFHLVESSLMEPSQERRLQLLDKSLEVMLEGTYEKMLHYAHDLKNPITMLHMLGVILPILGLVIFPLLASFMGEYIRWYHLALLYNVILPVTVFVFGYNLLIKRPTGYGESEMQKKMSGKTSLFLPTLIIVSMLFLGFFPLIIHFIIPGFDFELGSFFGNFMDYKCDGECGPFGLGALLMSLSIPLGLGLGIGLYYKLKTKDIVKIRNETKKLEKEFASSLFQLGNRLADGVPAELAFGTVAKNMAGTPTGNFFRIVSVNIRNFGMNLKEAIFNLKTGAILYYPSSLIQSSMEILLESIKKGSKIAAQALTSISNYVSEIHKVNERLKDLLSEIISSMKSQISFMAPLIAGIVIGIGSMIVNIIVNMTDIFGSLAAGGTGNLEGVSGSVEGLAGWIELFNPADVIPSYFFQIIVGIYIIELIYILTILANGIENGTDKTNEEYLLGKNLIRGSILYVGISAVVILLFNLLGMAILAGSLGLGGL